MRKIEIRMNHELDDDWKTRQNLAKNYQNKNCTAIARQMQLFEKHIIPRQW